jgi:TRAP-type transport system periplasmic protein
MYTEESVKKMILGLLTGCLLFVFHAAGQEYEIRFASVAPEGSTWMNIMRELDKQVRKESGGRLGFRIYPGGAQGDERDVLRRIRTGQLQAGGFTGVGMGEISPNVRILDSPFLFRSYDEVDMVYDKFGERFAQEFYDNGYVLLGWAEVGFVYVFSNVPIRRPEDMRGVKMWMWEGDPIAEAMFRALNINPIPLSVTDVMTSLQTRMIDAVYTSPLAAIALQWFTRVRYMLDFPLADASGAVLLSRRYFDRLPEDLREILLRNGREYMSKLTSMSREENQRSITAIRNAGVQIVDPPASEEVRKYEEVGREARRSLTGRLFTREFLIEVEHAIEEYRSQKAEVQ